MYIFGGLTKEGTDLGDLAAYRFPPHNRWYTFQNMGPAPSPRSGHTMTVGNGGNTILVMGGETSAGLRDEAELQTIYELNTDTIRYPNDSTARREPSEIPSPRAKQAVSPHAVNQSSIKVINEAIDGDGTRRK